VADVDDFLQGMRSESLTDSSGQFALDIRKAVDKLGYLFPATGRKVNDFVHYWLRFAVCFGAPEIVMEDVESHLSMAFAGLGPDP